MMTALCGDRGIGKTYHLAQEYLKRYQQGYLIVTNFDFVYSHINYANRSPEDFYSLLREILIFKERGFEFNDIWPGFRHSGVFIAIDEGHLFFSADLWKRYQTEDTFQDVLRVLAQARKLDIEVYYTTQDPSKIDKNWRRYTEDWIRFTPVFGIRKKIRIPHETKPVYRRELRHIIPLVWMEWHNLDHEHPVFDYSTVTDESGFKHWSPKSTLIKRRLRRAGWLDPFPYRLYDSNEILSVNIDRAGSLAFQELLSLTIVFQTFRHDTFSKIKRLLGKTPKDAKLPTRWSLPPVSLGKIPDGSTKKITLGMPKGILREDHVSESRKALLKEWVKKWGKRPGGGNLQLPSSTQGADA